MPPKYRWLMFFTSTLFFFYEFILRVSPGVMAEQLRTSFHINAQELGFMGSVFFQAYAWMQIPVGLIFDRFSTRKTLSLACLFCAIGTILFALSPNFYWAVIARCMIGIGAAFGFVGPLKIAQLWFPPSRFSFISGFLFTFGFLGAVISDQLLIAILHDLSWSTALLNFGFLGILLSILIYFVIHEAPTPSFGSQAQPVLGFKDLMLGLKDILKNPYIWLNGFIGFLMYFPTSAFAELWGKSYLETVLHLDATQAVHAITYVFIGWALGGPLMGYLSDFIHGQKLFLCLGSFGAALCISGVLFFSSFNITMICTLLFVFGIFSSTQILNFVYAMKISPRAFSATAIAVTNMIAVLGGACSQMIIGWFLDFNWSHQFNAVGMRLYSAHDFQQAFIVLPLTLILSGVLSLLLKKK